MLNSAGCLARWNLNILSRNSGCVGFVGGWGEGTMKPTHVQTWVWARVYTLGMGSSLHIRQ